MENKTNKEVIELLQNYYLKQDSKIIARCLANVVIDLHRIQNFEFLPNSEKECLIDRMRLNGEQLEKFLLNPHEDIELLLINMECQNETS